ncbi:MAG: PilZ domain-containing protein [candidate division Zixibacteria bacterium]|nr:PilZ domain-containing protein [candidate division Zixibacteria bacterium]
MGTTRITTLNQSIQLWERLELVAGESGAEGIYSCRVADIFPDRLLISRPVYEHGRTLLSDNRTVDVNFTRADAAYTFVARIRELEPKSDDRMFLLDLGSVRRLQRRRFVRIDKSEALLYRVLPRPLAVMPEKAEAGLIPARSINLSAGGMLVRLEERVAQSERMLLDMAPCSLKNLPRYLAAVCRHCRLDDDQWLVAGIEFLLEEDLFRHFTMAEIELLPADVRRFDFHMQNALVAEIFAEQIVMRQKGLL